MSEFVRKSVPSSDYPDSVREFVIEIASLPESELYKLDPYVVAQRVIDDLRKRDDCSSFSVHHLNSSENWQTCMGDLLILERFYDMEIEEERLWRWHQNRREML